MSDTQKIKAAVSLLATSATLFILGCSSPTQSPNQAIAPVAASAVTNTASSMPPFPSIPQQSIVAVEVIETSQPLSDTEPQTITVAPITYGMSIPRCLEFGDASVVGFECRYGNEPGSTQFRKTFSNVFPNIYSGTLLDASAGLSDTNLIFDNWYVWQEAQAYQYPTCTLNLDMTKYWSLRFIAFTNTVRTNTNGVVFNKNVYLTNSYMGDDGVSYFENVYVGEIVSSNMTQVPSWSSVINGTNYANWCGYADSNTQYAFNGDHGDNAVVRGTNGKWTVSFQATNQNEFFKVTKTVFTTNSRTSQ